MARSAAWERRTARVQALGYDSYHDYRAHNYGRRPPSEPRATGPELARLRGHRGPADLGRVLDRGDVELMNVIQTSSDPPEFEVLVTRSDGSTSTYKVSGQKKIDELQRRIGDLGPAGPKIVGSPPARRALRGSGLDDPKAFERAEEERAELEAMAAELDVDPDELQETIDELDAGQLDDDIPF